MSENKNPTYLNRFLKEFRYRLLQIFIGQDARNCVQKSLQEHKDLMRFTPTNALETLLTQPSDIWQHLSTLHMLTIELNLKTTLELGTAEGESTIALLTAAQQIGGMVHSIDINACPKAQSLVSDSGLQKYWDFVNNDDLVVNWDMKIDHLFIDTSHKYEHTFKELQKYEPHVSAGGIISLHDIISCPEVMVAIQEYTKNRNDLRIYKFMHNNGLAVIFKGKQTDQS